MTSNLTRIKEFFAPPVFPDDEDRTSAAQTLNTLLLAMMLFLVLAGGIVLPFVFVEKLYNGIAILILLFLFALTYLLMRRGRVRLANIMLVCILWIIFSAYVLLGGGMSSIISVFYVTITVVAGLLLGTRAALVHAVACGLIGLGTVALEASGHPLPRLFPVPPLVGWLDLITSLLLTVAVMNLVLNNINNALALARQQVEERKKAEEAQTQLLVQVQEQAQRIQQIMDTVPEGVLLLDPGGRILVANPLAAEHLLALAGVRVGDTLTHLGDRPLAELLTAPSTQGLWHEVENHGRTFEVIASSIGTGPQPLGWVLVIHDVTQQREAERHLQQQERLVALGQLAAGIAHDFNNIMAVITLYAGMSLRIPDLPPAIYDRLATIDQQAQRASALIQQILDFSRRSVLRRGPLDLVTFLKEQMRLLKRTLPENIQITQTCNQDSPLWVSADPTRIQQAILNLATNARDAMPDGGQLRIKLERLGVADRKSAPLPEMSAGEWACVTVTDTGAGIPLDVLPHVFDPFFTTKAPGQGTGLGLSQVYGIVRQHEGQVDVYSRAGEGTTFILYLPVLAIEKFNEPRVEVTSLPQGEKQTILVVEDEGATRQAVVETLEILGYDVLEATNGREALAIFGRHSSGIDLVLSDLVMPEMGGEALFHTLRQQHTAIKVLVMSGHPLSEEELKSLQAQGLAGWLPKPPRLEQLAQEVARVLEA